MTLDETLNVIREEIVMQSQAHVAPVRTAYEVIKLYLNDAESLANGVVLEGAGHALTAGLMQQLAICAIMEVMRLQDIGGCQAQRPDEPVTA